MQPNVSAIERAFQLARSGKAIDLEGLRSILKREGYLNGEIDHMPALAKQLRSIIAAAKERPAGGSQRAQG